MPLHVAKVRVIKTKTRPTKKPPVRLPWPRTAPDDPTVKLGINVIEKKLDIERIVHKFFRVPDYHMNELMQDIFTAIIHKNYTRSAHDPRKSSFGHYVYMISDNVCKNIVQKKRRYDRERDSIDTPINADDGRVLLDIAEMPSTSDDTLDYMRNMEDVLRRRGQRDLARYIRAVRSGASSDVIREALSWENHKMSNKTIRDIRFQVKEALETLS